MPLHEFLHIKIELLAIPRVLLSSISRIILERHLGLSPSQICLFPDIISSFRKMGFHGVV